MPCMSMTFQVDERFKIPEKPVSCSATFKSRLCHSDQSKRDENCLVGEVISQLSNDGKLG